MIPLLVNDDSSPMISLLRVFRVGRVVRILRLLRMFKQLSALMRGIWDGLTSLFWVCVLMFLTVFMTAVLVCETVGKESWLFEDEEKRDFYMRYFGGIARSMVTLFQMGTRVQGLPLLQAKEDWPLASNILVFYIAFVTLCLFSVVTAIFVGDSLSFSRTDSELALTAAKKRREAAITDLKRLFQTIDADGSGELDLEEFIEGLNDADIAKRLKTLNLDPHDGEKLFQLLDPSEDGHISIEEFINGLMKLQGRMVEPLHVIEEKHDLLDVLRKNHDGIKHLVRGGRDSNSMAGRTGESLGGPRRSKGRWLSSSSKDVVRRRLEQIEANVQECGERMVDFREFLAQRRRARHELYTQLMECVQ